MKLNCLGFPAVLTVLFVAGTVPATASVALVGTTTNPTGVTGLVTGGNTYNVTFTTDFFDNVFPTGPQFSTWIDASTAAVDLGSALNALGVTGLGGFSCSTLSNVDHKGGCSVMIPWLPAPTDGWLIETANASWFYWPADNSFTPPIPAHSDTQFSESWTYINTPNPSLGMNALGDTNFYMEWAVFDPSPSSVPEPASLGLLGTGLGLIALGARRKAALRRQ